MMTIYWLMNQAAGVCSHRADRIARLLRLYGASERTIWRRINGRKK